MLIIHASDLHLDSPLVGLSRYAGCPVEAIRGATRRALSNLVDHALAEQASLLLLAGDIYDGSWKDYATGLFFVREMARLREGGVLVAMVRGNHDAESEVARGLKLPENVTELSTASPETIVYEKLGIAVHGQGFAVREVTADLAKNYPSPRSGLFNIGLLHTALTGRAGHEPYAPCALSTLVDRGYDYWALGHVHQREVLSEEPFVVFSGNLQGRHVKETGKKGAMSFRKEGGRVRELVHQPLDVVRWLELVVEAESHEHSDDLLERVEQQLTAALAEAEGRLLAARVTVRGASLAHGQLVKDPGAFEANVRAIAIDLGREQLWISRVRGETRPHVDTDALLSAAQSDSRDPLMHLLGSLAKTEKADDELAALGLELAPLLDKLPDELRHTRVASAASDPDAMRELLAQVRSLLVGRILEEREP